MYKKVEVAVQSTPIRQVTSNTPVCFTPYWDTLTGTQHGDPQRGNFTAQPFNPIHRTRAPAIRESFPLCSVFFSCTYWWHFSLLFKTFVDSKHTGWLGPGWPFVYDLFDLMSSVFIHVVTGIITASFIFSWQLEIHHIEHLNHFNVQSVALTILTLLYTYAHHPAPQLIHLPMKLFNFSTFLPTFC